jgi:phage shock protein PspC (stress-responsive transcriptional regulator)
VGIGPEEKMTNNKKLYRSKKDRVVLGVAAGLGEYFDVDPIIVRLIFVLLTIWGGAGLLFYIVAAIVIPEEPKVKKGEAEEGEVVDDPTEKAKADAKEFSDKAKAAAQDISYDWKKNPSRGSRVFGVIILFIGLALLSQWLFPWLTWEHIWPVALIIFGLALILKPRRS